MALLHVKKACPLCRKQQSVFVKKEQLEKWENGMLIQTAFPELSVSQRELLQTGTCDTCWDNMFKESFENEIKEKVSHEEEIQDIIDDINNNTESWFGKEPKP